MGIRIHKFIGWGLTDVQTDGEYTVTDPRINAERLGDLNAYEGPTLREYRDWLDKNREKDGFGLPRGLLDDWWLRDEKAKEGLDERLSGHVGGCIRYNPEYGLKNVLAIRPVSCDDWERYDDMIDWIEETYFHVEDNSQYDRVEELPSGIYPFNGAFMDKRTGQRVSSDIMWWVRTKNDGDDLGQIEMDTLAQAGSFADHADALENCVPHVPEEIRALCKFTGIFTNEDVWKDLRPILYVWWG